MKITRWMVAALLVSAFGCAGSGDEPISWEEFQLRTYTEPDTGIMIINGDEPHETLEQLAATYWAYVSSFDDLDGIGTTRRPSIVNRVNGRDDVWGAAQAQNLSYCINGGNLQNTIATALAGAASDWEAAAGGGVNFVHATSQDGKNCTNRNNNVVFNVRVVNAKQYLARAFFPSSSRKGRELLISTSAFTNIAPWTLRGVLRHELGHALGLRHEHTRPEAGVCFEDNSWRALTAYDSDSVMHYPQCNGSNDGDLVLTSLDKQGIASLY